MAPGQCNDIGTGDALKVVLDLALKCWIAHTCQSGRLGSACDYGELGRFGNLQGPNDSCFFFLLD
jgi:hypothetical protein